MSKVTPVPWKPGLAAVFALPILLLPVLALFYWSSPEGTVQFVKQTWIFFTPWIIAGACIRRSVRNPFLILVLSYLPLAVWSGYIYLYFPNSFPDSLHDLFMQRKYRTLVWVVLIPQLFQILSLIYNHRSTLRQLESVDPR